MRKQLSKQKLFVPAVSQHSRLHKVESHIFRFLSGLLTSGVLPPMTLAGGKVITLDPFVALTRVAVSPDLKTVRVYLHHFQETQNAQTLAYFQKAASVIRKHCGQAIPLKYVPVFTFFIDEAYVDSLKVQDLIDRLHRDHPDASDDA